MRRALRALTPRGRLLLAGGAVALVLAFGLGDRDLGRLGVALFVAPLVAGGLLTATRTRLDSDRWVTTARVAAGESVEVRIRLANTGRGPSGDVLAEDVLPAAFGARPRFVVDRMSPGGRVDVRYPVRCDRRGRYRFGPLTVRIRGPFGLSEISRRFDAVDDVVVTPAVQPLPPVRLTGEWAGYGESTRRSVATAGEDDTATREYRIGDDLRRVHWRSTARRGELMVRREEQPWQSRAAVLLDTRALEHTGDGADSSLDWAISAVASIGVHLDGRGFEQRLVLDTGAGIAGDGRAGRFVDVLLDTLATASVSRSATLAAGLAALRHGGGEGLLVAVVAGLESGDLQSLTRSRAAGVSGVAILLDTRSWGGGRGSDPATLQSQAALLHGAGWRVAIARRGSDLGELWRAVGGEPGADLQGMEFSARKAERAVGAAAGATP